MKKTINKNILAVQMRLQRRTFGPNNLVRAIVDSNAILKDFIAEAIIKRQPKVMDFSV
jgi:hypothetical protein